MLRWLPGFGHEFVIVFFVLSGYVISWSADRKRDSLSRFAIDRAARILSVSVPLLLLSTAVSAALSLGTGMQMVGAFLANLVFIAQSWSLEQFPASDPPFWSLNYEVWYYALFGCAYFLRGNARVFACAAACAIAGPKILLLLPCWLFGSAAYFAPMKLRKAALLVATAALAALLALSVFRIGSRLDMSIGGLDLGQSRHFAKDYATAALVAIHLYAMRHVEFRVPARLAGVVTRGAAMTFTLYLVNYPMILLARAMLGEASATLACTVLALALVCSATVVVAMLTEAQTGRVRNFMTSRPPAEAATK
jgi:peptidoglycan/LPS O-acetylase OafA/YrhL